MEPASRLLRHPAEPGIRRAEHLGQTLVPPRIGRRQRLRREIGELLFRLSPQGPGIPQLRELHVRVRRTQQAGIRSQREVLLIGPRAAVQVPVELIDRASQICRRRIDGGLVLQLPQKAEEYPGGAGEKLALKRGQHTSL